MLNNISNPLAGIILVISFSYMIFLPIVLVMALCNGLLAWKLGYAKKQCWQATAYPLLLPITMVLLVMLVPEISDLLSCAVLLLLAYGYCRKLLIHPDPTRLRIYFPVSTAISTAIWLLNDWLFL